MARRQPYRVSLERAAGPQGGASLRTVNPSRRITMNAFSRAPVRRARGDPSPGSSPMRYEVGFTTHGPGEDAAPAQQGRVRKGRIGRRRTRRPQRRAGDTELLDIPNARHRRARRRPGRTMPRLPITVDDPFAAKIDAIAGARGHANPPARPDLAGSRPQRAATGTGAPRPSTKPLARVRHREQDMREQDMRRSRTHRPARARTHPPGWREGACG